VAILWRRGHHRRALPRLIPTRRVPSASLERGLPPPRHHRPHRGSAHCGQGQTRRVTVSLDSGDQIEADLLLWRRARSQHAATATRRPDWPSRVVSSAPTTPSHQPRRRLRRRRHRRRLAGWAHRGFQHGIFVAEDIAGLAPPTGRRAGIPKVTYCQPEVASVGLTEAAAKTEVRRDRNAHIRFGGNGKSRSADLGAIKTHQGTGANARPVRSSGSHGRRPRW